MSSFRTQPAVPTWAYYLARPTGQTAGPLHAAYSRKLSFFLDSAATATFTMPGTHPETATLAELSTDVLVSRNGVALFRGRVGGATDTLTADADTVAFTATDYRGMLDRRIIWSESLRSFRVADQADLAWDMIADTQALPGGNLGITRGAAYPTGILRDRDYDPGKGLGEALTQLGQCEGGFNWEVDAERRFNLFYPQRGRQAGLVLTYGRDIVELTRTTNQASYANAVYFTGSSSTTPDEMTVESFDAEIGRWDAQKSDPSIILQPSVDQRAAYELASASTLDPAFSVVLAAGAWDPAEIWLGDWARLIVRAGRLNVDVTRRIVQIDVELTDDGGEKVTLAVADAVPVLTSRLQSYNSRLNNLERTIGYIPDAPVGTMFDWPGSSPPALYMWADGSMLSAAQYPELYAVIGTTYGTGGAGTFALPDCRGRVTVAAGSGGGLTARPAGQEGGAETVALSDANNAAHGHALQLTTGAESANHGHALSIPSSTGAESANHSHTGSATSGGSLQAHSHGFSATTGTDSTVHHHNLNWSATGTVTPGSFAYAIINQQSVLTDPADTLHQHAVSGTTGGDAPNHTHAVTVTTTGESVVHGHDVTVSGNTQGESVVHNHNVGGNTAFDGGGTPHENMPPFIAIGKVIKVVSPQNQ